jgi:nucleotide-binding universal stress UspA family protein
MTTRLLIAHDGSAEAGAALTTASALFPGGQGVVVTVFTPPMAYESARPHRFLVDDATLRHGLGALARQAEEAARETADAAAQAGRAAGLELEPRAREASSLSEWPALLAAADEHGAEAIVCGSRGRGGVARSLLGSTSSGLVHHADRPVLVVPEAPEHPDGPALVAYDGSPGARAAIARTGELLPGRAVVVAHVWRSPIRHTVSGRALGQAPLAEPREFIGDYEAMFEAIAADVAEEGAALAREAGLEATGETIESPASIWRALAEAAVRLDATAIVAGSRGRGSVASALLGSVSSGLVHNASTPSLVVPGG